MSTAVHRGHLHLHLEMQLVSLVPQKKINIKQSSSEFLGSRVKIPFFCTVCGVCYTTKAYGASDLVVILHKWTFVEPREVTRRYSLASGVTSCVQ